MKVTDEQLAQQRDRSYANVRNKWNSVPLEDHDKIYASKDIINDLTAVMPYVFTDSLILKESLIDNFDWNNLEKNTIYPFQKISGTNTPNFTNLDSTKATGYVFSLGTPTSSTKLQICFASDNKHSNVALRASLTGDLSGSKWFCLPTDQDLEKVKDYVDTAFAQTVQKVVDTVVGKLNDLINADPKNILDQMAQATAQVDKAVQQMKDLDQNARDVKDAVDSSKGKIDEIQKSIDSANAGLGALSQLLAQVTASAASSKGTIDKVAKDVTDLNTKYSDLTNTAKELKTDLETASDSAKEINSNYNQFKHDLAGVNTTLDQVKSEAQTAEDKLHTVQQNVDKANAAIASTEFDVQTALNAAKDANKKVDDISLGARNYLLKTSGSETLQGNGEDEQVFAEHHFSFGGIKNAPIAGQIVTMSVTIVEKGAGTGSGYFGFQFNGTAVEVPKIINSKVVGASGNHPRFIYTFQFPTVTQASPIPMFDTTGICMYLQNVANTYSVTVSEMKLELGNIATDWLPAPEDSPAGDAAQEAIAQAKEALESAKQALTELANDKTTLDQLSQDVTKLKTDAANSSGATNETISKIQKDIADAQKTIDSLTTLVNQKADASALDKKTDVTDFNLLKNNVAKQIQTVSDTKADRSTVDALSKTVDNKLDASVFNNLEIGGRNYLVNSAHNPTTTDPWTISRSSTNYGTQNVKVGTDLTFQKGLVNLFVLQNNASKSGSPASLLSPRIKVPKQGEYTLSFYVSGNSYVKSFNGSIVGYTNVAPPTENVVWASTKALGVPTSLSTTQSQKVVTKFTTDPDWDYMVICLSVDASTTEGKMAEAYIADMKLEIGNQATDWTPALEELSNDSSLQDFKDSVTNNLTSLKSTVDSHTTDIKDLKSKLAASGQPTVVNKPDFNTMTTPGTFIVQMPGANSPVTSWGTLLVYGTGGTNNVVQYYILDSVADVSQFRCYVRDYFRGVWSDWDIIALASDLTPITNDIKDLKNTVASHTTSINSLNKSVTSLSGSVSDLNDKVSSHDKDISKLKTTSSSQSSTISSLSDKVGSLNTAVSSAQSDIASLTSTEQSDIAAVNKALKSKADASDLAGKASSSDLTALSDRVSTLSSTEQSDVATINKTISNTLTLLKQKADSSDLAGKANSSDLTALSNQVADLAKKVSGMTPAAAATSFALDGVSPTSATVTGM